jgi:hypothetical protein
MMEKLGISRSDLCPGSLKATAMVASSSHRKGSRQAYSRAAVSFIAIRDHSPPENEPNNYHDHGNGSDHT